MAVTQFLTVTVHNLEAADSPEVVHYFRASPVTVGSAAESTLRLADPRVSHHQGLLLFSDDTVQYMDSSNIDGVGRDIIGITPGAPLQIGPFRIFAALDDAADDSLGEGPGPLAAAHPSMPRMGRLTIEDFESLFELSARAIAVLNLLAEVIVEVRRKQAEIWTTVRASSPLRCSSDPDEITDYLLDSVGAEARLAELRNYFIELVRRERPSPGPIAQA